MRRRVAGRPLDPTGTRAGVVLGAVQRWHTREWPRSTWWCANETLTRRTRPVTFRAGRCHPDSLTQQGFSHPSRSGRRTPLPPGRNRLPAARASSITPAISIQRITRWQRRLTATSFRDHATPSGPAFGAGDRAGPTPRDGPLPALLSCRGDWVTRRRRRGCRTWPGRGCRGSRWSAARCRTRPCRHGSSRCDRRFASPDRTRGARRQRRG